MRVLVTGVQGQLARAFAERARGASGIEVACLGCPALDFVDFESIDRNVRSVRPDVVVNAAAFTAVDDAESKPDLARLINAEAPERLAHASRAVGARIIQISTDYVFDGLKTEGYIESDPVNPLSVYGRTKLEGEKRVASGNPHYIILRTAWLFSPFGRNFVKTMLDLSNTRDRVSVVDDQQGSPTSAYDLADAIMQILTSWRSDPSAGMGQIYHLAGAGVTSWCGLATHTFETSYRSGGPFAEILGISSSEWPSEAPRPANSILNCSKFAADFVWHAPQWEASVEVVVRRLIAEFAAA